MSNLRHIFGLTAAISVGALIAGSGACAQAPTVSANPLAGIDPLTHAVPAERTASRHEFLCEGKPYVVEVTQTYVGGENLRRVNLSKLETPYGSVSSGDRARLDAVLEPFHLLFSVSQQCRGSGFGFSFYGRRRGEPDNVSVTVWFEGSRLTRVGP